MQQYQSNANDEDDAKGADKDIVDDWMSMMKKTLGRGRR